MYEKVIFREYDIRGVYNQQFDLEFAELLGKALVTYLIENEKCGPKPTISIGFDARISSPEIAEALSKGILSCGAHVVHLGLVTTPICYFSTFEVPDVDGAFMVTGSHNPPEYNGFKISAGKSTIFGDQIQELRKIIENGTFRKGQGTEKKFNIFPLYINRYKQEFGQLKPVKIVLDCGNGAAGIIARQLFESVGLSPIILFEKPDGRFPNHHPDPTVEKNLVDLKKAVKDHQADVGIGFDGDADRIGVVDHKGSTLYGDELMVIMSRAILKVNKGAKIIGDVKCSDRLYKDIAQHEGQPIMWKTGHSLIKEKIKLEKAPFGGEMSGHIFFADRNYGFDDALYAGLRLVEVLSKTGMKIPDLMSGLPKAYNTPEIRVDTTEEKKILIVEKLKSHFQKNKGDYTLNLIDGIRISYPDGWALARSSNTQPVLVLRFESNSPEGLQRIEKQIRSIVDEYL